MMEETGVRKCHSVTARTARVIRRDVIGRYHWLRVEPRLKVILLSSTMAVLGACAFTGTSGGSLDSAGNTAQRTGPAASQTVDECLAWDIACRLEQPVWLVAGPGGSGPGGSGPGGSGPGGSGPGDSGPGDSSPGDSGKGNNGPGNGGEGSQGESDSGATGQDGRAEGDPSNPGGGG